jgi:hypothetical protein
LELREHRPARGGVVWGHGDGQVLQPGHGLDNLERQTDVVLDAQLGCPPSQIQHVLGRRRPTSPSASSMAPQGTASITTSASKTASAGAAARTSPPNSAARAASSAGCREKQITTS